MPDPTPDPQALARQRAQIIMQVRSGVVTALGPREQGRPTQPRDLETASLRRQLTEVQAKLTVLEQTEQLRQRLAQLDKKNR